MKSSNDYIYRMHISRCKNDVLAVLLAVIEILIVSHSVFTDTT
jgi:hypothetical protein